MSISNEQESFILENYKDFTNQQLAEQLNLKYEQVRHVLRKNQIKRDNFYKPWSEEEISFLKEHANKKPDGWIADRIKRVPNAVTKKRIKLGLYRPDDKHLIWNPPSDVWTEEEIQYLIENFERVPVHKISLELGRTPKAIQVKATKIGITQKNSKWTLEEDEFLSTHFSTYSIDKLSELLNRSRRAIEHRISAIGLKRNSAPYQSQVEKDFSIFLIENGINHTEQFKLGPYLFDFKVGNHLIEFHGDYYHCNPHIYSKPISSAQIVRLENDKKKEKLAIDSGYNYVVVWESDFIGKTQVLFETIAALRGNS